MEIILGAPRPRYLRVPRRFPRFLSDDEAARLLDAAPVEWRSTILVGLRTGLRIGELRGLQWGDIDFPRGVVVVRRTDPGRRDMPQTTPKGGAERMVALSPEALAVLHHRRSLAAKVALSAPVWESTARVTLAPAGS
jgi:integrase